MSHYHVGISSDFKTHAPGRLEPLLAELFDPKPEISYSYFNATGQDDDGPYVTPQDVKDFDAVILLAYRFSAASFVPGNRVGVIARWGVGYDSVDVSAATAHDVLLAITVDGVRRPVAEAILTLLLALAKKLPDKDKLVRVGRWDLRGDLPAVGLRGKTVGSVGLGNIGSDMFRLLAPFELGRQLAADPYAYPGQAKEFGVELVDLETVFRESDFVTVNCPLTDETDGLVNAHLLSLMKPTAYLINTARGPIVNQGALVAALQAGQIAGAGLDVFAEEPIAIEHPLLQMDNVILAPHALAWTDELYRLCSQFACENVLTVFRGEIPEHTVNKDVTIRSTFLEKLQNLSARRGVAR
ncbi:MAG: NAD(P)-dependent oxidoreductase [Chloroflexota bacterium]